MTRSLVRQPKPRFPVLWLVLAGVSTAVAGIGGELLVRGVLLKFYGQTVDAEVTRTAELQRGRRSANSPYILEYRFRPAGVNDWYTHVDTLSHAPCHVGLSRDVWEAARAKGQIRVEYVPRFPSINRPAEHTPLDGLLCPAVMAAFAVPFAGMMWMGFLDEFRNYRRARTCPPPARAAAYPPMQPTARASSGAVK